MICCFSTPVPPRLVHSIKIALQSAEKQWTRTVEQAHRQTVPCSFSQSAICAAPHVLVHDHFMAVMAAAASGRGRTSSLPNLFPALPTITRTETHLFNRQSFTC